MKAVSALSLLLALASQAIGASARGGNYLMTPPLPPPLSLDEALSELGVQPSLVRRADENVGFFDQLLDHSDPSKGTFKQRYWWDTTYYAGPGSPITFFTPGEIAGDRYVGYLTNRTLTGMLAQAVRGAVVIVEHRYWGQSSPYDTLNSRTLQYLTLNNSIADFTRFALEAKLPFDTNGTSHPTRAPWVFVGGSYPGALSGWTERLDKSGAFWAYHASSAVVQDIADFWQYFSPIQRGMPQNCSADAAKVIDHIDSILTSGTTDEKLALKTKFNLAAVEHDDDFAEALASAPYQWQSTNFNTGYSGFYEWCDYVENAVPAAFGNATVTAAGPEGVGLEKAFEGYAKYARDKMAICSDPKSLSCVNTYNMSDPYWANLTVANEVNRQWNWFLCNEPFKWWQTAAPEGHPSLVSRLINTTYFEGICARMFPDEVADGQSYTYGINRGLDVSGVNTYTRGGWSYANSSRVLYVNGEFDPWRDATVSSESRPGGPLESTKERPVLLVKGGIHTNDLLKRSGDANPGVAALQAKALDILKGWIAEFPSGRKP